MTTESEELDNKRKRNEESLSPTEGGGVSMNEEGVPSSDVGNNDTDESIPIEYISQWDSDAKKRYLKLKKNFDQERDEILSSVPESLKSLFGQVGFAKWGKTSLPVLARSPYDVSPGAVRKIWFEMYEKLRDQDRLKNATLLVYWYGSSQDLANAYSLIPTKNFISYEDGVKRGYNKITPAVQKKLDSGKASKQEKQRAEGLKELEHDLEKSPQDRCGYVNRDWNEVYIDMADESDDDDVLFQDEPGYIPKSERPKKKHKRNSAKLKHKVEVKEDSTAQKEVPKKRNRPGQRKKNKADTGKQSSPSEIIVDDMNDIGDKDLEDDEDASLFDEDIQDKAVDTTIRKEEKLQGPTYDEEMAFLEGELSSHSDKDDEAMSITSEEDEDYEGGAVPSSISKENAKKKGRPRQEKKEPSMKFRKRKEQQKFTDLEVRFGTVIASWKTALESNDEEKVEKCLQKLLEHVDSFSAPFIEEFRLADLLKTTKKSEMKIPSRKELWDKMKVVYAEKKKDTPENFKAKVGLGKKRNSNNNTKMTTAARVKKKVEKEFVHEKNVDIARRNDNVVQINGGSQEGTAIAFKPETMKQEKKKKFSLGTLMRPATTEDEVEEKPDNLEPSSSQVDEENKLPDWIAKPFAEDKPHEDFRIFASEFIRQGVCFIPRSQRINLDSVALSIEMAAYEWAKKSNQGNFDWRASQIYWQKIHTLVACISGQDRPGSLAAMIGKGVFMSAADLLDLKDELLSYSFESRHVPL